MLVALALGLAVGCAATTGTPRQTVRVHFDAPGEAQLEYRTTPPAGPAMIGPHAFRVGKGLQQAQGGTTLEPDPRLARLAQWVIEQRGSDGETPPHPAIDLWSRHLGLPEPAPHLIVLAQSDPESLDERVARELGRVLSSQRYTHFGAATDERDGILITVLALSWRWASLDPIPRRLEPGDKLVVRGTLDPQLKNAALVVSYPDGTSTRAPRERGRAFAAEVETRQTGEYRVEILADSDLGTTVVANFPVYVGVEPVTSVTVERAQDRGEVLDAATVNERLRTLINRDRKAAGLNPLASHDRLSAVALAHSRDMHANDFVGHTSPTTGGAGERVKRADIRTPYVLENIGRGYSPEEVHRGLMDSPGHRANVMAVDATHLGIGTVVTAEDERAAYLVTELFGRFAAKIDVDDAGERVAALLNAERKKRGLPALVIDDTLTDLAQTSAKRFFDDPHSDQSVLLKELSSKAAQAGRPYARLGAMMTIVPALEDVRAIEALLDPAVRGIGLGVSQGSRADTIPNGIAIVAVVGY